MDQSVTYPTRRLTPLDPPPEFTELRAARPVTRMTFPDGHVGWLVTSHAAVRALLADRRFSRRAELLRFPIPTGGGRARGQRPPPGTFALMDPPEHTRIRRMLTGHFSTRRAAALVPRIEQITRERLDAMAEHGPPVDLVTEFAMPIPAQVICELLGLPYADFMPASRRDAPAENLRSVLDRFAGRTKPILGLLRELIERGRQEPADGLIGELVAGGELTDDELVGVGFLLFGGGLETTANMLALGTWVLLRNPAQLDALRADDSLAANAVEELLRYLTIFYIGPVRTALEDVELEGHLIRAGETVALSASAANRDPDRFADPDVLDLRRETGGHLAFGHGIHQCIAQQLARVELRVAFPALLRRFPTLRLAIDESEVPLRQTTILGVDRLPVAW